MADIKSIDANTLKTWLDRNEVVLIDVREPAEYESKRIPGSTNIPLGTIQRENIPALNNKKLVMHCGIGKRSRMACEKLVLEDPQLEIYNLEGGITAWQQAQLPTKQGVNKTVMSLDRQAQILIGGGVLIGVILGFFIHPLFLLLALAFGLLLLFAGMKGSSILVMLVAQFPWNKSKASSHSQ